MPFLRRHARRRAAARRLSVRQCARMTPRLAALGLCARRLPLRALPQGRRPSRARLVAPDGVDGAELAPHRRGVSRSPATSSTRRPTTWARPSSRMPRAKLAEPHGAELAVDRRRRPARPRNYPADPCGRPRGRAARAAADRYQLGRSGRTRKVTLVGKGVCFDTGGLDIKPSAGMLLHEEGHGRRGHRARRSPRMIMAARLPVRLRVLIPAVENSISGNAFRPRDCCRSRKGMTVEIGNTDAEGRLILADALALADEREARPDARLARP